MTFLIIFAGLAVWLIAKTIEEQGKKTRQLVRGQAADEKYSKTIDSLDKREEQLHARDEEWKDKHLEAALAKIEERRAEAEAELQDAWDIEERGLAMSRFLGTDDLSMLAMDIARHEILAEWHTAGRSILKDTPVRNYNCEGGWDKFSDEWGEDIAVRQKEVRNQISSLSSRRQQKRLEQARERSAAARAFYAAKTITLPDGSKGKFPWWMGA